MGEGRGARRRLTGLSLALAAAVLVAGCGSLRERSSALPGDDRDIAVVLLSGPNRLVSVDLGSGDIVGDVHLRSLALDMSADASTGVVVTAQCGGVADNADDALGVYRPREDDRVSYVTLPAANPGLVAVGDGRAFVEHGLETGDGLFMSIVDLATGAVVGTGTLPSGPGGTLAWAGGRLHMLAVEDGVAGASSLRLASADASGNAVSLGAEARGARGVAAGGRDSLLLFGRADGKGDRQAGAWISDVSATGSKAPAATVLDSADVVCAADRWIAAGCWGGDEPTPGRSRVAWFDRDSGQLRGSVAASGGVCALSHWGDRLVVIEKQPCRLVVIDTATEEVLRSVALGDGVLAADVEVLPGTRADPALAE